MKGYILVLTLVAGSILLGGRLNQEDGQCMEY
jgi:hypothetical protein